MADSVLNIFALRDYASCPLYIGNHPMMFMNVYKDQHRGQCRTNLIKISYAVFKGQVCSVNFLRDYFVYSAYVYISNSLKVIGRAS